ncbi:flagellar hook-basal body complex protein FliE [Marinobacterium sp. D7]|uniref:flagellar hook-basal body complex protein FliE n=1 Tax=Marinobacterium ramblicola TaxID=2849041 RepID=UPI001C2DAD1C|nr:flagellar hook-basal body complex protein FliE [Marinobacterium ramblicola]MBV1787726.1 flagellar hook-basal body complex protein FliE [Marinobacterium ramblicola]
MTIESISFIAEDANIDMLAGLKSTPPSGSFVGWLSHEMSIVNSQINQADIQVQKLATGEEDNLHQVMMSLEKAKLSFELGLQVRNKLLEGYQEIMRMQV